MRRRTIFILGGIAATVLGLGRPAAAQYTCETVASRCDNDPDNQFALRVYWQGQGEYTVCAANGVCGSVYARGPG